MSAAELFTNAPKTAAMLLTQAGWGRDSIGEAGEARWWPPNWLTWPIRDYTNRLALRYYTTAEAWCLYQQYGGRPT